MRGKARTDDSGDERGIWDSVESQILIRSKQRKGDCQDSEVAFLNYNNLHILIEESRFLWYNQLSNY